MARLLLTDHDSQALLELSQALTQRGHQVVTAQNGRKAWQYLQMNPNLIDAIILDQEMDDVEGFTTLEQIRRDSWLSHVPVIMHTTEVKEAEVIRAIEDGAFHVIGKPFKIEQLDSIIFTALQDRKHRQNLTHEMRKYRRSLGVVHGLDFECRTLKEAMNIAYILANAFPRPEEVVVDICELLFNAIEHGNLGISYEEKSALMMSGTWENEVEERLQIPEFADRTVRAMLKRSDADVTLTIEDQGNGFDWKSYTAINPDRFTAPYSRGIGISRGLHFDHMEYKGKGNKVVVKVTL